MPWKRELARSQGSPSKSGSLALRKVLLPGQRLGNSSSPPDGFSPKYTKNNKLKRACTGGRWRQMVYCGTEGLCIGQEGSGTTRPWPPWEARGWKERKRSSRPSWGARWNTAQIEAKEWAGDRTAQADSTPLPGWEHTVLPLLRMPWLSLILICVILKSFIFLQHS